MVWDKLGWVVFLLCVSLGQSSTRISFPGCDRAGWKCNKVQATPIKYEIEYACQGTDGINFLLWNFNAPAEIKYLKVINCTSVEIDLTCTQVGRQIERLHVRNVGVLNFTNILYKDTAQMPERVLLENIKEMPLIPEKTFKQMKHPVASIYRCAVNTQPMDRISFYNVGIGTIEENAFYNLTEMKEFKLTNVTVNVMKPLAMQVSMDKDEYFDVSQSTFNQLDYKAFSVRSPKVYFQKSIFNELPRNVIDSTSFKFYFVNNTVRKVHSFAFILLSQDITIEHNHFESLKTSALQGIGPGLLENAFMSFGQLKFTYNFNNNTIAHSDIGGLNPDWIAYKNVRSYLNVTFNKLPCSCKELGWITLRSGLGDEFSSMMTFNSKYLDKTNQNLCLNSPCDLPVTAMSAMNIKFGLCGIQTPLINFCKKYKPNQPDLGLGTTAKVILNKWQNDFPDKPVEEYYSPDLEAMEDMFALAQKTDSDPNQFIKYSKGNPKETYFKLEKTGLMNIDPIDMIQSVTDSDQPREQLTEIVEPNLENSTQPDIIFKDDDDVDRKNGTIYKYQMDVRNGTNNGSNSTNVGFDSLKKEYEENQKEFTKKTYQQWQAQRKKRMVYFKLYGNLVTLD